MSFGFHPLPWEWRLLTWLWEQTYTKTSTFEWCNLQLHYPPDGNLTPDPSFHCLKIVIQSFEIPLSVQENPQVRQIWHRADRMIDLFWSSSWGWARYPTERQMAWDTDVEEWKKGICNDSYNLTKMVWLNSPVFLPFTLCVLRTFVAATSVHEKSYSCACQHSTLLPFLQKPQRQTGLFKTKGSRSIGR